MKKAERSAVLEQIFAHQLNMTFMLHGEIIGADEVFSSNGFLPLIGFQAALTCKSSLNGRDLGIELKADPEALVGAKVAFDDSKSQSLQLMYLFNAATELFGNDLTPNRTVTLDSLLDKIQKEEPVCKVM